ncbi:MAG: porphobilinogen synthase [Candidatus Omnitrophica bacterium]|nr:porphobilinogen synthase [Candidatus Omnitrophota bacterium]
MSLRDRRKNELTRKKLRETQELSAKDLIMPIFVKEGILEKKEIKSMPGIYQFSLKQVVKQAEEIYSLGIPSIILFGIPAHKDKIGSVAYDKKGIVQEAIGAIKTAVPRLNVIADVCMCGYTTHGHCGIIKNSYVDNVQTVKMLSRIALSYACAGADTVAPSAMMDGQVRAIKEVLIRNNYPKVRILAYSVKYASSFYNPFRDAVESAPKFGDRKTYQMDYYNSDEAILEAKLDIQEGADMLMVKPALGYQDIIYRIKKELKFPLACYSVSGEYAMIKAASVKGYLDEKKVLLETMTGFKRAGADLIISYYAQDLARWLKQWGRFSKRTVPMI